MTRALADSLADALLRELPPERAYDRKALQEVALPGPVAHFLRHALDEQARREVVRLREARTGWIDYDAPDVREAFETLAQSAQNHARIPAGEWEAALHRATRETGAYLVRPRAALRRFVFAENDSVPARHVLQRMNFFSAYSYFGSVLRQYAEQREIERMNADRFAEMLRHIDQRMTSDHTPAEWSRMLKPLFAFAGRARRGPNDAAPAPLLRAFFEEKERDDLAARLPRGEEALTREDLRRRLEADNEAPAAGQQSATSGEPDDQTRQKAGDGGDDEGPVPLWKQFQPGERGGTPEKKREQSPGAERRRSGETEASGEAVPRWQQFRGGGGRGGSESTSGGSEGASSSSRQREPSPSDALSDLEREVLGERGAKNRSYYLDNLFGGSRENYRATLRALRGAESWSEAQQVVAREVFRKHQVDIYGDAAVSFTDAVQQRFR